MIRKNYKMLYEGEKEISKEYKEKYSFWNSIAITFIMITLILIILLIFGIYSIQSKPSYHIYKCHNETTSNCILPNGDGIVIEVNNQSDINKVSIGNQTCWGQKEVCDNEVGNITIVNIQYAITKISVNISIQNKTFTTILQNLEPEKAIGISDNKDYYNYSYCLDINSTTVILTVPYKSNSQICKTEPFKVLDYFEITNITTILKSEIDKSWLDNNCNAYWSTSSPSSKPLNINVVIMKLLNND